VHEFIIKKKRDKQLCLSQSKSEICIVKKKKNCGSNSFARYYILFFCSLLIGHVSCVSLLSSVYLCFKQVLAHLGQVTSWSQNLFNGPVGKFSM
jgi:hypothetical protein